MSSRREQLETLISEAYQLLNDIDAKLLYSDSPMQSGQLRQQRTQTEANIRQWEAELEKLEGKAKPEPAPAQPKGICPTPQPAPEHFGGRSRELTDLRERLRAGGTTAITALHGLGGIGKTTLARKLAHEVFYTDKLFRAVLWADIGREPNVLRLLNEWSSYGDPHFATGDISLDKLADLVKALLEKTIAEACAECEGGRVLVVLDDVWPQSLDAARLMRKACPEPATVLITTRSLEVAVRLQAEHIPLDTLSKEEGAQLLAQLLPATDQADRLALAELLGGHALALTIAAGRVQLKASRPQRETLKAHLGQYRQGLPAGEFTSLTLGEGEKREENVRLALSYSYADLKPAQQARFRALGAIVHDTPFDLALLQALWQAASPEQGEEWADELILASLLEVSHQSNVQSPGSENEGGEATPPTLPSTLDSGRATLDSTHNSQPATRNFYRLHPLLHAYAVSLLGQEGDGAERAEGRRRYEEHAITLAAPFEKLPPQEWKQLAPDIPHIHAVGDGLVAQTHQFFEGGERAAQAETEWEEALARRALDFARNTYQYLFRRREVRKREWLDMGLAAAHRLHDREREGLFLGELGLFCDAAGQKTHALYYYEQALQAYRETKNRQAEATILNNIAAVYDNLGQPQKALEYYQQDLAITQELGDRAGEAPTLNNIGLVYRGLGEYQKALQYYEQSLHITQEVGDRAGEAATLNNIGSVHWSLKHYQEALQYYEQALPIRREVGDRAGEASSLLGIGAIYYDLGEYEEALQYCEQALPISQEVGDRYTEATICGWLANIYKAMGRVAEAVAWQARCVEIREQVQHPDLEIARAWLERWRAELGEKT